MRPADNSKSLAIDELQHSPAQSIIVSDMLACFPTSQSCNLLSKFVTSSFMYMSFGLNFILHATSLPIEQGDEFVKAKHTVNPSCGGRIGFCCRFEVPVLQLPVYHIHVIAQARS